MVQERVLDGVQFHFPRRRINRYRGRVWHYPLAEPLGVIDSTMLGEWCADMAGIEYDLVGAFRSRDTILGCLLRRKADLTSLFCSELCAAALTHIGRLPADTNPSSWSPNRLCRTMVRQGIHTRPIRVKSRPCPIVRTGG